MNRVIQASMEKNTPREERISILETCEDETEVKQKPATVDNVEVEHQEAKINIVVVGLAGSGKTSLISKLCGYEGETLEYELNATLHEHHAKEYQLQREGKTISIHDTLGLSDPHVSAKKVLNHLTKDIHEINLLVICLKLYDKVDNAVIEMMENIKKHCGRDIFSRTVLILTQADEYQVHCRSYRENQGEEAIKEEFTKRIDSMKEILQNTVVEVLKIIREDQFPDIPVCVSSFYMSSLPTIDDWESEIWKHMLERCEGAPVYKHKRRCLFPCCFKSDEEQ